MKNTVLTALLIFTAMISCAKEPKSEIMPAPDYKTIDLSGYQLVFSDEFDGKRMDWGLWEADNPNNVKHETSRGPEAVSLKDGELRLNVKRVNVNPKVKWTAGFVFLKEPLENNVYIECRFKSGDCTGVNNAFWLACKTPPNNTFQNKYEVDIVEARKDAKTGKGNGHLAWHDWKTYQYTTNSNGAKFDIAQGIVAEHDFDSYHVWGLWYGESEMIYYLDGEEVWRGRTHPKYKDQYFTGVGKSPVWNPLEQERAYGRYGQSDWSYYGGYNGDKMHIILANIPWGESWSPLVEEQANGTYMAVDYVRIYKPKAHLVATADTDLSTPTQEIVLNKGYALDQDNNIYISCEVTKKVDEELTLNLHDLSGSLTAKVIVDAKGNLLTGITKLTSSEIALSPVTGKCLVENNVPTLLVCRITAKAAKGLYDKDAISVWSVPKSGLKKKDPKEPYFYHNIDENGNTSLSQGWYINQKGYSDEKIGKVAISSSANNLSSFGRFRAGTTFISVTK